MTILDAIPFWVPNLIALVFAIGTILQTLDQLRVRLYATFSLLFCSERRYGSFKEIWTTRNLSDIDPNWKSISSVSGEYRSAFTPVSYTFAIWGPIYILQVGFLGWAFVDSLLKTPYQPFWVHRASYILVFMYFFEIIWLYTFTWEYLWVSELAIVLMTSSLTWCYAYVFPQYTFRNPGGLKQPTTVGLEYLFYIMISVSLGWNLVATFAGFFTTGILRGGREESVMFIVLGAVLPTLSFAFSFRHGDFVVALVFLWASFGISRNKKKETWVRSIAYTGMVNVTLLTIIGVLAYQLS
jgi:hypothetical protein